MKELKKLPRLQLEKFSTIFTQLGLVLVLFIVFISLEHQSEVDIPLAKTTGPEIDIIDYPTIPILKKKIVRVENKPQKAVKPKPKVQKTLTNKYKKIDNNEKKAIESMIVFPPVDNVLVDEPAIDEVPEDEIIDKKDDPKEVVIGIVSKVPVFRGCENLSEEESRKCLDKKISRLVNRHFDSNLGSELGLRSGRHVIHTQFVIDKEGKVSDIKVRNRYKPLEKEAKRVIEKIPDFIPGEFNGKKVGVKYSLPITFKVE